MENKEPKTEFNVGDVVRLKSDFTNMVIESMPDENHAYCVQHYKKYKPYHETYDTIVLVHAGKKGLGMYTTENLK